MKESDLNQLRQCLLSAGLFEVPQSIEEPLSEYGFDSLALAMSIIEIERSFGIKIPARKIVSESLKTIADLVQLIEEHRQGQGK